jgi:hypothetical protein
MRTVMTVSKDSERGRAWNERLSEGAEWVAKLPTDAHYVAVLHPCPESAKWTTDWLEVAPLKWRNDISYFKATTEATQYAPLSYRGSPRTDLKAADVKTVMEKTVKLALVGQLTFPLSGVENCTESQVRVATDTMAKHWYRLLVGMPCHKHLGTAQRLRESRRLRGILTDLPQVTVAICVSNLSEKLRAFPQVVMNDLTAGLKGIVKAPTEAPVIGAIMTVAGNADWPKLRADGKNCSLILPVGEELCTGRLRSTVRMGVSRFPVKGERGEGNKTITNPMIFQYLSQDQADAVRRGLIALVARGIPDVGPGMDAARWACHPHGGTIFFSSSWWWC